MNEAKPLPCPYCGQTPILELPWVVTCGQCRKDYACKFWGKTRESVIDQWNHWAQRTVREVALAKAGFEPVSAEQRANNMAVNMLGLECDRAKMGK